MKKFIPVFLPIILIASAFIAQDSLFLVYQHEQAVVVEFGKFIKTINKPGLNFKKPFIQNVVFYDKRLLGHDVPPTEIVTKDKRNLIIDNFAKWRIFDPEKFYTRARTEAVAQNRLRDVIYSELRLDFGVHSLEEIVSSKRSELMDEVTKRANTKIKELDMGIEIIDVRIKRADLPSENQLAVFRRMTEERKRIAMQFRSEGKEAAQKIRATTDKEKTIILAKAYEKEQTIMGEGDAQSIKITAEAYGQDIGFYEFIRSLDAYKVSLVTNNTLVLSQKSPFLKYLR